MYIYTVYTYHNYAKINTILAYSNFLSAYHSYLPLKQWIIKLYKKCITEYFSLPYDFTFEHKNGDTGLVEPHSGISVVQILYTIIYIISVSSNCIKSAGIFCADHQQISSWLFRMLDYTKSVPSEAKMLIEPWQVNNMQSPA